MKFPLTVAGRLSWIWLCSWARAAWTWLRTPKIHPLGLVVPSIGIFGIHLLHLLKKEELLRTALKDKDYQTNLLARAVGPLDRFFTDLGARVAELAAKRQDKVLHRGLF